MNKKVVGILTLLFMIPLMVACGSQQESQTSETSTTAPGLRKEPYAQEQFLLGTYTRIRVYDEGKEAAMTPAFERIKELGDKITINEPDSEIDEINENAGIQPVKVSPEIYQLVKRAKEYSVESEGAFNLVIGGITQLWRIGFDDARKPSDEEIQQALTTLDYQKVQLDDENETVYLEEKGMIIDLGAIAKGYIADEVATILRNEGVTSAIIDLGGNILVLGHSNRGVDQPWKIGIQDPNDARGSIIGSIEETDKTVVTSGVYERYLELDGVKYHHIFDTQTGYPIENDVASVSIITDHSIDGDALTTLVFAKGIEKGLAFVEENTPEGTDAIFISRDGEVYVTSGIKDTFELSAESDYRMAE